MVGLGGDMYGRAFDYLGGLLGLHDPDRPKTDPRIVEEVGRLKGLLGDENLEGRAANENRISSPDSRWGEDPAEIEARLRGSNAGWHIGQGGSAEQGARGMMPGLSEGGRIAAQGGVGSINQMNGADSRWGEDPDTIEATLRGRNAGYHVGQGAPSQEGSQGMMPGLSPGGRIAAAGKTVLDYASQGGPFRQGGPMGGLTEQVAGGLVNFPRAMGFNGDPTNDINRFAGMAPTPMAGMGGPRMAGAGVGGGASAAPMSLRAAPPPGMIQEQSRLDDKGDQWMTDPASGAEINISEMERSTARYMEEGAGFSSRPDDLAGKVAQHVRGTSANVRELGAVMKEFEPDYNMMNDIEPGYRNGAQSYLPETGIASVQGDRVRFIDPDPGQQFLSQYSKKYGHAYTPFDQQHLGAKAPVKVPVR